MIGKDCILFKYWMIYNLLFCYLVVLYFMMPDFFWKVDILERFDLLGNDVIIRMYSRVGKVFLCDFYDWQFYKMVDRRLEVTLVYWMWKQVAPHDLSL